VGAGENCGVPARGMLIEVTRLPREARKKEEKSFVLLLTVQLRYVRYELKENR
jgi:hypothetical protein